MPDLFQRQKVFIPADHIVTLAVNGAGNELVIIGIAADGNSVLAGIISIAE
jgi:hypothetical protein